MDDSIHFFGYGDDKINYKDFIWQGTPLPERKDMVNSPAHYTRGKQDAIEVIEEAIGDAPDNKVGYLQGQVLKYLLRMWLKDQPKEDAEKALEDDEYMNQCLQLNSEQKKVLYEGLNSQGYEYLPSRANFISFDCKKDSNDAFNKLLHEGVIVRSLGVYKMPNFLRVSIGLPEENLLFLEKLKLT